MSGRTDVAERLQAFLAERELAPGDRLPPERQLANELGISRSSLREALGRLINLGIVQTRQGSGTYVAPVDVSDLLAVRLRLEPYAARLAARRRGAADLAHLDAVLDELRRTRASPADFAAADARLHSAVVDASASLPLRVLLDGLADLLRHSRATAASEPALRDAVLERHERLVQAIREGDGAAAERAMRAHLRALGGALAQPPPR